MYTYYYPPYLMHHGVKGMKWGVRHDPEPSEHRKTATKMNVDAYASAGYDSNGDRKYKESKRNEKIYNTASVEAKTTMEKYFGKDWDKDPSNMDIYETILAEAYEELERSKIKHSDELYHYGVKGMKWGVRKDNRVVSSIHKVGSAAKRSWNRQLGVRIVKAASAKGRAAAQSQSIYRKSKSMSDDDLRKAINRMQLERQYRDLKAQDTLAGKAASNSILETYGTAIISRASSEFVNQTSGHLGRQAARAIGVPVKTKKK